MAILTNADYQWIKNWVKAQPAVRQELRTWPLSRTTLAAALQAIETYQVGAFSAAPAAGIRATIEAVTGATTSLRAQYLWLAWVAWRIHYYLQGG